MNRTKTLIMGAAGRDFHDFLLRYRDDDTVEVVAFTATQIPGIDSRVFPEQLAGPLYPNGIEILPESRLLELIRERGVERVVFAYSDVAHEEVMHKASAVIAAGADFVLMGAEPTMVTASVPVLSVCAVRTGAGKSGVTERVCEALLARGLRAVAIRHPMPYRDLLKMAVERYATIDDLDAAGITVEEREEYEHLVERGIPVFAGVDYTTIVREAEKEADVIVWDGGNNDLPFVKPDLEIVVVDPHRAGHERRYHPGEANLLRADIVVINKVSTARPEWVDRVRTAVEVAVPNASILLTDSVVHAEDPAAIKGKRVLVVEDGPSVTHSGMTYGAGAIAARTYGASALVDPRPFAVGSIASTLAAWPHLSDVLPAMGYSPEQLDELCRSISAVPCDLVLIATPIDLARLIDVPQPTMRVTYRVEDIDRPTLDDVVESFCAGTMPGKCASAG